MPKFHPFCKNGHHKSDVFSFCEKLQMYYKVLDVVFSSDVNECEATPKVCAENTVCENTVGSYKCTSRIHPHVVTKILREEDYDDENEDDEDEGSDNDDYGDEITEVPQSLKCENGFKKNKNFECVGKCA